ncbi:MAG: hypothetical protein R2780_11305 [Crocinitomicaceae bacterium]|nr:hypothetical protein [Crocinitomicaceae bacterium]
MHKQRLFVIIAAAIGILSAFLPWISINLGFLGKMSISGVSGAVGDGWATLALAAAAGGFAFTQGERSAELDAKNKKIVAGLGGAIVGYILFFVFVRAQGGFGAMGYGVWLTLLSGLGVLAVPFVIKGDGGFEMPTKDSIKADIGAEDSDENKA